MKGSPFSPLAVAALFAAGLALFVLSMLSGGRDGDPVAKGGRVGPGTYSLSAVGHAGLYDVLRRTGRPASRSTGDSPAMTGARGTLVVAEPNRFFLEDEVDLWLWAVPRLLLVLPKWRGAADAVHPAWISDAYLYGTGRVQETLALVDGQGAVLRGDWPARWTVNQLGVAPTPPRAEGEGGRVQLVVSPALRPVVGTEKGMLVGEIVDRGRTVWVLADPDVMANHGIGKGSNAAFMLTLLDALRFRGNDDPGAPIVFDETAHGFQGARDSPAERLFRFPFVVVTALAGLAVLVLAFAASGRFGAPTLPEPELDFGKAGLIGNSVRLLDYAGHHADVFRRYALMTVRLAARALHAPADLDGPSLAGWLDRLGEARKVPLSCAAILRGMEGGADDPQHLSRLFAGVRDIHRWKGDILNGTTAGKPGYGHKDGHGR
ncbi:MAG: DUF4350 domain-containing protein [Deltaproteobacteria bacterium]|jgi:hypothetical protein|nr:DUF4350 domain-containing protein [Deltaproteobacteria bacterium]